MPTMMRRLQKHLLTNINNVAAIDYGFSQGLDSYDLLPEQNELKNVKPVNASLDGSIVAR